MDEVSILADEKRKYFTFAQNLNMHIHDNFIRRTFQLAQLGAGSVSPNPMVGAVLVHNDRIIGEGYHECYGHAHAEVNALKSVDEKDQHLIDKSTLYVSLEPCCIFGRTPPCTNLILENKIPKVVISCLDLTPKVAGNGVKILRDAGVEIVSGILEKEGLWLSRFRRTFVTKDRPHIILKFAQSQDGFLGKPGEQVWLTNAYSKRYVHKIRSEIDAILIGSNTARVDNPQLTNRLYFGKSPLRIVLNKNKDLPTDLKIFQSAMPTWWVNKKINGQLPNSSAKLIKIAFNEMLLPNLMGKLQEANVSSLMIEGGAATLQHFIDANLWDEAQVLTANVLIDNGIKAPSIFGELQEKHDLGGDSLSIIQNMNQPILPYIKRSQTI
ncbi:MAG: diaminohydroxyphosphoribosylaminopyrimidine deaminase [Paraglaciecola sp.]|jgi:diaminohydroxyphosphoribosylaminopyrimidine deaminase/5-amino-6-(5-phosphoribosylamino)uracil reductase